MARMTMLARKSIDEIGVHVKVLERYPVVRIRPLQNGLKHHKVIPGEQPALVRVRDAEERRELRAPDLGEVALGRDGVHELLAVEKSASTHARGTNTHMSKSRRN